MDYDNDILNKITELYNQEFSDFGLDNITKGYIEMVNYPQAKDLCA